QGRLRANREQVLGRVRTVADSGRRMAFRTEFDASLDKLGKLAGDPAADIDKINAQAEAFAPLAAQAGVDAATIATRVQAFKDRNWTNQATSRLINGRDDAAALAQLERDLADPEGYYAGRLDTEKRNGLLSQVLTARGRLETRAQVDAGKAEATAERALKEFERNLAGDFGLPDDVAAPLIQEAAGGTPEQRERLQGLIALENEFRGVRYAAPQEQAAFLAGKRAEYQANGATPQQAANLQRMERATEATAKLLRESPLQHMAQATGRPVEPINIGAIMPRNAGEEPDVRALSFQIGERAAMLESWRGRMGNQTGTALLLPQESEALTGILERVTPAVATRLFGSLSKAIPDRATYLAVLGQVGVKGAVPATAGALFPTNPQLAERIITGHAALNPAEGVPKFKLPPAADLAAINSTLGPAFAGRDQALASARAAIEAAYAGESIAAGDYSGEINTERLRKVMTEVVGKPVEINGASVLPPLGMAENDFRDAVDDGWSKLVAAGLQPNVSAELDDYLLRGAGGDSYLVMAPNGTYLMDAEQNPVRLRVDPRFKAAAPVVRDIEDARIRSAGQMYGGSQ
ncbi:hypothetical protein, partial [Methylibium sp.]|uniref:hypothetical protein n=1 Tax=Methylibium sp. TaxID=2067992 RepID=UPI0033400FBF